MFERVMYKIGDDLEMMTLKGMPRKAKIRKFIYHRSNEEVSVHFVADY